MNLSAKSLIKVLENNEFTFKRFKGEVIIFTLTHPQTKPLLFHCMEAKGLPKGTFYAILRQAGIDKSQA